MDSTKLTLSVSNEVIEKAKRYAKRNGTSISFLVEQFFKEMINQNTEEKITSPSDIDRLKGIIELPENYDYKTDLSNLYSK